MPDDGPRLRMAPAPSGFLHLGNVRTFLFDHLYTRGHGGVLVLRIEDTDAERSTPEAEAYIVDSLAWLGIEWQEGPDVGGPHAPYRQSEREDDHRRTALSLLESGHAYECFCTAEELDAERRAQQARGEAPRYSGRCYRLTQADRQSFRDQGRLPALRFHVPTGREITWNDLVYGHVSFKSDDIGDFIILRPNGAPIYNLANVADDHGMEITLGLRGQSHLPNSPRQIMLYQALGWTVPEFAHVPDVLDLQGRKMGKRFGAKGVTEYRDEGYLPQAIVNYIALLGWSSPTDEEFLSMDELCAQFSFDRVQRSNAAFDPARLEWFNAQYIRRMSPGELVEAATPFLIRHGLIGPSLTNPEHDRIRAILPLVQERVRTLAEIPPMVEFFYRDQLDLSPRAFHIKNRQPPEAAGALEQSRATLARLESWTSDGILNAMKELSDNIGWKRGDLLMALRIAVTGRTVTPPLTESMEILGKDRVLARIDQSLNVLAMEQPA